MAIIDVEETWDERSTEQTSQADADWTRSFRIWTDALNSPEDRVLSSCGIRFGDPHPRDSRARCKRMSCRQDASAPMRWTAVFRYDRVSEQHDPKDPEDNPLQRPARWKYGTVKFEESVEEDINGLPIVNAAGDPFIPPLVIERALLTFQVQINRPSFDPDASASLVGKVNDGKFGKWKRGTVKMDSAEGEELFENGVHYFSVTYAGTVNPKGWIVRVMNRGFNEVVGGAKRVIRLDGHPVPAPVPLDLNGARVAVGGTITFLSFTTADETKFPAI